MVGLLQFTVVSVLLVRVTILPGTRGVVLESLVSSNNLHYVNNCCAYAIL